MKQEDEKPETAPDDAEEIAEAVELSYGLRVLGVRSDPGQQQPRSPEASTNNESVDRGIGKTPGKS
jgi:hypothetical protein